MPIEFTLALLLVLLLVTGGAALFVRAAHVRREQLADRLQLIATHGVAMPQAPTRTAAETMLGPLVRQPGKSGKVGEQATLLRICRRLRIADQQAARAYTALRIASAAALGLLAIVLTAPRLSGKLMLVSALIALASAYLGWVIPGVFLDRAATAHAREVESGLPDALELLVVCVAAGLSLEDGIDRVTTELRWSQPALAEEFSLTSADLKILPDRDRALANLAARIDAPSVRSVVTALSQTLRYGTPLAQGLRSTAAELRNDALLRMEERANQLPPLLTLPMMLFIMPTIFLVIGGPAVLRVIDIFASR